MKIIEKELCQQCIFFVPKEGAFGGCKMGEPNYTTIQGDKVQLGNVHKFSSCKKWSPVKDVA
jgi:hypothetical protein